MLLDELGALLHAEGVGVLGTSLFLGSVPLDTPTVAVQDQLVALVETPGLGPLHVHNQQQASYEQPTVQVLVRDAPYAYASCRLRAQAAFDVLDGLANVTLSGVTYLWIYALQSPFYLRNDDYARPYIIFNIRCAKAIV